MPRIRRIGNTLFAGLLGLASEEVEADIQQASGLMSKYVSAAPQVDGIAESVWDGVPAVAVTAVGGANAGSHDVTLKSVYSGDQVYFLVQWTDPTEST